MTLSRLPPLCATPLTACSHGGAILKSQVKVDAANALAGRGTSSIRSIVPSARRIGCIEIEPSLDFASTSPAFFRRVDAAEEAQPRDLHALYACHS